MAKGRNAAMKFLVSMENFLTESKTEPVMQNRKC